MQEAVAIAFESRKEEAKLLSANADDLTIATVLLSELQKQQETECRGLLNFADMVKGSFTVVLLCASCRLIAHSIYLLLSALYHPG